MKLINVYTRKFLYFLLFIIFLSSVFLLKNPYAFQKTQYIRFVNTSNLINSNYNSKFVNALVDTINSTVNHRSKVYNSSHSYEISINNRISEYFLGNGDCSNQCYALSVILKKYDFDIVHILPKQSYLKGDGHTMLLIKPTNLIFDPLFNKFYYIVEPSPNKFLIIDNFKNPSKYILDFNSGKSFLGIQKSITCKNYLKFLDKINILNFKGFLNNILYEYISIIFFQNTIIEINHIYSDQIYEDSQFKLYYYIGNINIYTARLFLISLFFILLLRGILFLKLQIND